MFDTWWERAGLTKEQGAQLEYIADEFAKAGLGYQFGSLIDVVTRYAPTPKPIDNMLLIDKERVRNSVNQQIKRNWKAC